MKLIIRSPEGELLNKDVDEVKLPGVEGQFTILEGHAPLIAVLSKGDIIYRENVDDQTIQIESGFVDVADDLIQVCVD